MMADVDVSVVVPAYNEGEFIGETVESLIDQTFENYEIIVVDDASEDDTAKILSEYAESSPILSVEHNENNLGWAGAVNEGIKVSDGQYVAFLDAGDTCVEDRLEIQYMFLESGGVDLAGSFHNWIDSSGEVVERYEFPTEPSEVEKGLMGIASVVACPCLMVDREVFRRAGLFDTELPRSSDYDFFARCIAFGFKVANIPEYLVSVRKRKGRGTDANLRSTFLNEHKVRIRYLSSMLSFRNIAYTVGGLIPIFLPSKFLREMVGRSKEGESGMRDLISL